MCILSRKFRCHLTHRRVNWICWHIVINKYHWRCMHYELFKIIHFQWTLLLSQISFHEKEVHKIVSWSKYIYILFACIYFPQIIISVLTLAKKRDLVGIIYATSLFFLYDGILVYFYNIIVPHMELIQGQRINQIASQILFIDGLLMYMKCPSKNSYICIYFWIMCLSISILIVIVELICFPWSTTTSLSII